MAFADAQSGGTVRHGSTGVIAVTLTGTAVKGDALSSAFARALATVGTATQIACVALEGGASGDVIPAAFGSCIVAGRFSGGTAAAPLYVAEGTSNGQYTETAPATTGDCNTIVGYAISATEYIIMPNARAKTLSA